MGSTGEADAEESSASARRRVEAVWRIESARIVASLTRVVGDFALAEDLAQEALLEALAKWPNEGVPPNPGAWLTTVAKRRAIDGWRRNERLDDRYAGFAHDLAEQQRLDVDTDGVPWDPDSIDDDMLRLVFTACHPILPRESQIALTLRVVGGLTTEEIAKAFMVPVATIQQRVVRAKKTLAAADIPFEVPAPEEFDARLGSVLSVAYLIFNEGYAATSGESWMRTDLAYEAIRLTRIVAGLVPKEPEVQGLLALMELQASRFAARTDANGEPILLADQDRSRWDHGPSVAAERRWRAPTSPSGVVARTRSRPASPSVTRSLRRPTRPTGTRSSRFTKRSPSSPRPRSSTSTSRSRSRWPGMGCRPATRR